MEWLITLSLVGYSVMCMVNDRFLYNAVVALTGLPSVIVGLGRILNLAFEPSAINCSKGSKVR